MFRQVGQLGGDERFRSRRRRRILRRMGMAISLILLIPLFGRGQTAVAQGGVIVQHSDTHWQATYWNNTSLSGSPAIERPEPELNYDWGNGSPDPAVGADHFSARWTRYIDVTPGTYYFTATSDDGIRIWVDGDLLIDQWHDHAPTTYTAERTLGAGHHLVKVEYYENRGVAVAKLSLTQAGGSEHWRGEYYNNRTLSGSPSLVRDDPQIGFAWGSGSPAPGQIHADVFSVRWSRNLDLSGGRYRFTITVDDGARLYVNGHLLIDAWRDQPPSTYTGEIHLPGGPASVQMEYYENYGDATARLTWSPVDDGPIQNWRGEYYNNRTLSGSPKLVRDDADINFAWGSGSPAPDQIDADVFSVRWTRNLDLSAGTYHFTVTVDDGARLYVDGHLLIDAWKDQAPTTYTGDIYLRGGSVTVQMEYYEHHGGATAQLQVSPVSLTRKCTATWFFSDGPLAGVCPTEPIGSFAAAQRFERGMMIWLKQLGRYIILDNALLYDRDVRKQVRYVHDPLEITRDTSEQVRPPAGLYAPQSGFGLVWRGDVSGSPGYSQSLGWALAPEFGYQAALQCDDVLPSGGRSWQTCYLKGPDGEVVVFHPLGGWYLLGER